MTIDEILNNPDRGQAYLQLVKLFVEGTDETRNFIVNNWDFRVNWKFPEQTRLACSVGENKTSKERIQASLAYYAIAANRNSDMRDNLIAFAVLYHSCIAAGLDPASEFLEIAILARADLGKALKEFIQRTPEDKSPQAFKLVIKRNLDGEIEIRIGAG